MMAEHITDHAEVRIPPPVLTFLHILAAFLLDWLIPLPNRSSQSLTWLGILLVLIGLMLGFLAVRQFILAHTTLDPHGSVSAIVTEGPYRLSRNPIYLGFVCMLIGIPLAFGTYWGVILSPLLVMLMNSLVIKYEEAYLEKKFGDQYTSYKSRVRRWL